MKKQNKFKNLFAASSIALAVMVAPTAGLAATADDWNIATYSGVSSLAQDGNENPRSTFMPAYTTGQSVTFDAFVQGTGSYVDYRFYKVNQAEGSVKNIQNLQLNTKTIANGGDTVFNRTYALGAGFPTGEYVGVYRGATAAGTVMKRDRHFFIIKNGNLAQNDAYKASNTKVTSKFSFISPTGTSHAGRTGTYKVTSPSGAVLVNDTFSLGSNEAGGNSVSYHKTNGATFDFAGYLNGTYKITYTYVAGGVTYSEVVNVVISGGLVSSVTAID